MNHVEELLAPAMAANGRTLFARLRAAVRLFAVASPASAARRRPQHSDIAEVLNLRFSKARVAAAMARGRGLVEVFSTADGATWTIVVTPPQGTIPNLDELLSDPSGDDLAA